MSSKALLIVDVQNDFTTGGALAVPGGDEVVPVLNEYISLFSQKGAYIIASRDWHPKNSKHFKTNGGPWPVHCLRNTPGAAFHGDLKLPSPAVIISKGTEPQVDGYTAFQGRDEEGSSLNELLKDRGVREIFIGGLATDYCVKQSVLSALKEGYETYLLEDALRGVDLNEGDSEKALGEMKEAGAKFVDIEEVKDLLRASGD